ncbi:MAG: orotate phosphoribosyltransferase [Armatimonadetes bacterium]|nr:orotate phosphoribosyltransferase [Armatimonadota bacterium]
MSDAKLAQLTERIKRDALKVAAPGQLFTLASGKQSHWFVNGKEVTLRAEGLALVAELMLERIQAAGAEAVGGVSIGADPMIGAITALSAGTDRPLQGFIVRKAAKDHGLGDRIAGPSLAGITKIAMVEDVTTTGGSTLDAIAPVLEAAPQAEIVCVLTIVDRLDGAAERYAEAGYPFEALLTRETLGV